MSERNNQLERSPSKFLIIFNLQYFPCLDEATTTNYRQERQSDFDSNILGVASVAGVTSRNGRISTTGGIHFYRAPEGTIATNGDGYYNPLTFTKATNGKYASGSVQIHPGALGISSSAQAGYIDPNFNPWPADQWRVQNQWPLDWPMQNDQWPVQNQLYTPFGQRTPWFKKVKIDLPQTRDVRWMYPSFNPFMNLWR